MNISNRAGSAGLDGAVETQNQKPAPFVGRSVNLPGQRFDVADKLPEAAREKLRAWRERREELAVVALDLSNQANEVARQRTELQGQLKTLTSPLAASAAGGRVHPAGHPAVKELEAKIARLDQEHQRFSERRDAAQHRRDVAGNPVKRCEDFLRENGNTAFAEFTGQLPSMRKGEGHGAAVERLRKDLARIDADLHETRSAPRTVEEAKAIARADIEKLADAGAPGVHRLLERRDDELTWPQRTDRAETFAIGVGPNGPIESKGFTSLVRPDAMALTAWLHRDELIARVESEIDAYAGDGALTASERNERESKLLADRLKLQRSEEQLIEEAAAQGVAIERRSDADALALLGIEMS